MPVILGSKAEQANLLIAALVAAGVDLEGCATADQVQAAIGKALKPAADVAALEQELETAADQNATLETQLSESKKEVATYKAKADAFEARLGKLDTGNDNAGKDTEEDARDSLDSKIASAVAKAVADHYQAAGGGIETVPGDQGQDAGLEESAEEYGSETEYFAAIDKAESEPAREKLFAAMRKKFPLG